MVMNILVQHSGCLHRP